MNDFFYERVGQLEVMWDGELVREFFPIPYSCYDFEKDETAKKEMPTVLRAENPDQQHQFYLEIFDRLTNAVEQKMQFQSSGFTWLRLHQDGLRGLSFFVAIVINIIITLNYALPAEAAEEVTAALSINPNSSLQFKTGVVSLGFIIVATLGCIQVFCSLLLLLFHILVQSPLRVQAIWDAKGREVASTMSRRSIRGEEEDASRSGSGGGLAFLARITLLNSVESRMVKQMFNNGNLKTISFRRQPLGYAVYSVMCCFYALLDPELCYNIISVVMAVLGLVQSPLFLSYHLLSLIQVSGDLQAVTNAISHTAKQVMLTLSLIMVLTYLYTIILMTEFLGYSTNDSDGGVRGASCSNLLSCLLTSVDAIRQGGIGSTMDSVDYDDPARMLRILFDSSYFIVISIVLLNMVLGIIIDSFAELRKANEDLDDRLNNVCYICCLERRALERGVNGGFTHHRQTEHNPFFYFYFLMHLREKMDSGDELSGVESYVQSLVDSGDSSFFPTFQAISVKRAEATTEQDQMTSRLSSLEASQERILAALERMEKQREKGARESSTTDM